MNILVTIDRNYLAPFETMLLSLLLNNPGQRIDLYLLSDDVTQQDTAHAAALLHAHGGGLHLIPVPAELFCGAPVIRYYSRAMYYRLLAAQLLPGSLDRILYLDPDILTIGSLRPLYDMDMGDALYAAAVHEGLVNLSSPVNKIRLSNYETEGYFNSGVLLMNLPRIREAVSPDAIFRYAQENRQLLILPDQDILNGLYGAGIMKIDETLWNYDARKYREYLLASQGEKDIAWVMGNTAILHFCGKNKPWKKNSRGRFTALYRHYMHLTEIYRSTLRR